MTQRSGIASSILLVALLAGCFPYGFAGGGLPAHIDTVAIIPFDNETSSPEVQRELFDLMRREMRGRLGVRDASESKADAIVRGTILRYDVDIPIGVSANPAQSLTARRKLQIVLDVEIVDQSTGKALWQKKGLIVEGEYAERNERDGRRAALQKAVNDVVEGAQSQW